MLTYIIIGIAVFVVLFIIIVASRPSEFTAARSAKISAPPEKIFPHVNDLHKWEAWSPWAKLDPNAKHLYEGAPSGVGAVMSWEGNCQIGVGRMAITESHPSELVRFRLDFQKPMKATNLAEFTFKPDGGQTLVTWSMSGKNNFLMKAFGLFMNCDKMIGSQFDKGLASLKSLAEAA